MQAWRESVGVKDKHHPFAKHVDQRALLDDDLYKYKHPEQHAETERYAVRGETPTWPSEHRGRSEAPETEKPNQQAKIGEQESYTQQEQRSQ